MLFIFSRTHSILWMQTAAQPVSVAPLDGGIQTLATKPITEWNVPYIYMFGGVNAEGQTLNTLYRGVINQLRFKPLQ